MYCTPTPIEVGGMPRTNELNRVDTPEMTSSEGDTGLVIGVGFAPLFIKSLSPAYFIPLRLFLESLSEQHHEIEHASGHQRCPAAAICYGLHTHLYRTHNLTLQARRPVPHEPKNLPAFLFSSARSFI